MSEQLTINEKRAALEAAGKRLRSNASDETIEMAYLEYEAELEAASGETSEVSSFVNPPTVVIPDGLPTGNLRTEEEVKVVRQSREISEPSGETIETVLTRVRTRVLRENTRDYLGDKEPEVIEWARQNLSPDDFDARYSGRI